MKSVLTVDSSMPSSAAIPAVSRGVVMAVTSVNVCSCDACARAASSIMPAMVGSVSTSLLRKFEKAGIVIVPLPSAPPCCI